MTKNRNSSAIGIRRERIVVPSRGDNYPLVAHWFEKEDNDTVRFSKHVIVIVSGGTGVCQTYYYPFAEFVASYNTQSQPIDGADQQTFEDVTNKPRIKVSVVTYDYRGMGESKQTPHPTLNANIIDWSKDFSGIVDYVATRRADPNIPFEVVLVGHSVGSHLLCFTPKDINQMINRVLMVSVFNACFDFWKPLKSKEHLKNYANIRLFFGSEPILSKLYGYFPAKTVWGAMEDLPSGVAKQWHYFQQHKQYAVDQEGRPYVPNGLEHIDFLAWVFQDDVYTNQNSVEQFNKKLYDKCHSFQLEVIKPEKEKPSAGVKKFEMGHLGFFRKHVRDSTSLWKDAWQFMIEGKVVRRDSIVKVQPQDDNIVPNQTLRFSKL